MGRTSVPQSIDLIGMICDLYVREFYHRKIVDHIFLGKLLMTMKLRTPVYHGDSLNPVYFIHLTAYMKIKLKHSFAVNTSES